MNNMFIFIGSIVLGIVNLFRSLSFKNIEFKREDKTKEINSAIFSKLKFEDVRVTIVRSYGVEVVRW